ncbi:CIS tube protein [Flavimaricola marinus]|uniref:Contractile injection system tube protein N-terminal domain-containing protein n=1 Tax=Flavimaricola marinus TaxID=1819565 RepID=A0A238LA24_9RHOB|nr:hypothetical protein [Flavimaricola marinus]SMY06265.1 hypothetical protein LOM8899_00388 [Flavimaricola marinus]
MSKIPGYPKTARAALVVFEAPNPIPSVITLQYNPDKMQRDVKASAIEGGARSDAFRLTGAPVETIKMEVWFDATDKLAEGDPFTIANGIYPQLASLEMLLAPSSAVVVANSIMLAAGTIEILPASAPFLILVWGKRVLPVRMAGLSVGEEAFDVNLNPIRAKVGLDFTVLTYSDLEQSHPGYAMYLGHQIVKEQMGRATRAGTVASILSQKLSTN